MPQLAANSLERVCPGEQLVNHWLELRGIDLGRLERCELLEISEEVEHHGALHMRELEFAEYGTQMLSRAGAAD